MKLRYIFGAVLSALLLVGCSDDKDTPSFGNVSQDDTFIILPTRGGDATIKLKAEADWYFENIYELKVTIDGEKVTKYFPLPVVLSADKTDGVFSWLTVDKLQGSAGHTTLTFHAEATEAGREADVCLNIGGKKQYIRIRQGSMEAVPSTCADIIAGPDGKSYRVTAKVKSIANTTYGNMWIEDETGEVYIYGTLDKDGAEKNFSSWGIEVGDIVTVEGPKTTYGTTVELVNVTVLNITKSLLKLLSPDASVSKAGGELEIKVAFKGNGTSFEVAPDAQSWLLYKSQTFQPGIKTIFEANPSDTAVYRFEVAANTGAAREGVIAFSSSSYDQSSGKVNTSLLNYTVKQEGSSQGGDAKPGVDGSTIVSIADFNAAAESTEVWYQLTGKVTNLKDNDQYGNFDLVDESGSVYVYGLLSAKGGEKKKFQELVAAQGIKEGSIITIVGTRGSYNGKIEVMNAYFVSIDNSGTPSGGGGTQTGADGSIVLSVAAFNAAAESTDVWYQLTGKVTNLKANDQYGNFDLVDSTGSVYVYGLLSAKGGEKKKFQELVAAQGIKEGSTITIVGTRGSYNGKIEVMNAYFVSIEN